MNRVLYKALVKSMTTDEGGFSFWEYAIGLVVVAASVYVSAGVVGGSLEGLMGYFANWITNTVTTLPT